MEESDQDSFGAFAVQSKGLAAAAAQRAHRATQAAASPTLHQPALGAATALSKQRRPRLPQPEREGLPAGRPAAGSAINPLLVHAEPPGNLSVQRLHHPHGAHPPLRLLQLGQLACSRAGSGAAVGREGGQGMLGEPPQPRWCARVTGTRNGSLPQPQRCQREPGPAASTHRA